MLNPLFPPPCGAPIQFSPQDWMPLWLKKKKKRNTFLLSSEENQLNTNQIIKTKFIQFVSIIEQKTIREVAC